MQQLVAAAREEDFAVANQIRAIDDCQCFPYIMIGYKNPETPIS